jgi:hypothetical protein
MGMRDPLILILVYVSLRYDIVTMHAASLIVMLVLLFVREAVHVFGFIHAS